MRTELRSPIPIKVTLLDENGNETAPTRKLAMRTEKLYPKSFTVTPLDSEGQPKGPPVVISNERRMRIHPRFNEITVSNPVTITRERGEF